MDYTEKQLDRQEVYKGIVVDITVDRVALSDGRVSRREIIHHPGGAAVLPVDDEGFAWCVRQYRYAFGTHLLEIPAGKLEPGEAPGESVRRELSEETGLTAGRWTELGSICTSPGITTEVLYLYLATELRRGEAHPDPGEFLDVIRLPFRELYARVLRGEIRDGKTVAAVLKAAALPDLARFLG